MVAARSAAEMPVVVFFLESIDTVKAVCRTSVFSVTMSGSRNSSSRSPMRGRQMMPLL